MIKNFIINIPIYEKDIMFSFGESDVQFKKSIDKYNLNLTENDMTRAIWNLDCHGMSTRFEMGQLVIRTKDYPKSARDMGTLQHEIFHAVSNLLDYIGFNFNNTTDEPAAYLISYITEKVYSKCFTIK